MTSVTEVMTCPRHRPGDQSDALSVIRASRYMSPVVTVTVSSSLISLLIRSLFQKKSESFDRYRFRIECTFRELKQQTGAFCYRFWSKYLPKLSYYQKKGEPAPMERVEGEKPRQKVLEAVRAIEMHMAFPASRWESCSSICYIGKVSSKQLRYQRTPSKGGVSEAALMHYFRKHFFCLLGQKPELYIAQIIQGLQEESEKQWDSLAS